MNRQVGIATMEKFDNRPTNSVGSSRIRVRWLLPYWKEAEEYIIGKKYDVLIMQKVYWASYKELGGDDGVIKILDMCDPDWLENRPVFEFIDWVDAVTTSTQALADYILKLRPNKKVICIPDRIYLPENKPRGKHEGIAKKAIWFGYYHNIKYLVKTFDEIIKKGLTLTIVADQPYTPPYSFQALKINNIPYYYPGINEEIKKHDLAIFPDITEEDERGKFKSNNKTLQSWALGVPVVKTPEDMDRFMKEEERNKERELRLKEIEKKWDSKLSVDQYRQLIKEIQQEKQASKDK